MVAPTCAFIFAPTQSETACRIAGIIDRHASAADMACLIYTDVAMVQNQLVRLSGQNCFAVLLAADHKELELMVSMAPWLEGVFCILMVPDHLRKTIALAHRLRPRYLMWPEVNDREIRMVLHHIFSRQAAGARSLCNRSGSTIIPGTGYRQYFLIRQNRKISPKRTSAAV